MSSTNPRPCTSTVLAGVKSFVQSGLMSDQEFRDLLAALNFEATYHPTKRELTIRVTLVPELTHPDGPRAPLLFVLLIGQLSNTEWSETVNGLLRVLGP
jgi:hypothetical protein